MQSSAFSFLLIAPGSPSITAKKNMTKIIGYTLDARTEGQYHTFYDFVQCHDQGRSADLPITLSLLPGQLDFATHVTTNLNVLVMGDSVGVHQIGQNFMETANSIDCSKHYK